MDAEAGYCECDCFIWSGSLFRMAAVAKIGLPSADYVMDLGELEYGYRARELGFSSYIVFNSLLHQDVGRKPGVMVRILRLGPLSYRLYEMSPLRCYYHVRNMLYFWLYQCRPTRSRWVFRSLVHAVVLPGSYAVRPVTHRQQLIACLRELLGRRNDAHGAPILRNNGAARFCAVAFRGERSWVVTCYVEICRPDTQIDSPIDASAKIATIL